jgi:hypothetical protein
MNILTKVQDFAQRGVAKIVRTAIRFPAKWYCNKQFEKAFTSDYDVFWIVDIDNTIADTWRTLTPQYLSQFGSESDRMMRIEPFETMQQLFKEIPPRTRVIFLSARQYIRYSVTKTWLKEHGFWQADSILVLVERMHDKVPLLEGIVKTCFKKKAPPQYIQHIEPQQLSVNNEIINNLIMHDSATGKYPLLYFDDLSYNHEHSEVLFYQEVITAVKQMPILYIGYEELLQIQDIQIR